MRLWIGLAVVSFAGCAKPSGVEILNVSYDSTRELYSEINAAFEQQWLAEKGQRVRVRQSHGGSGKQARAVIDGLEADVVSLALAYDVDVIAKKASVLPEDWQSRLPHRSAPFASTIVLVVRAGNPKRILDWDDLVRPDVSVITANPKTSGGARWNYLAAYAYALRANDGDDAKASAFASALYRNVSVLDAGARGSATTFVERGMGDVLIAWESEARLLATKADVQIVTPSVSILAEPPVALVEKNAARRGTTEVASAYLAFLYSEQAQEIAAKHFYRRGGVDSGLVSIDEFGGWAKAQATHFDDHGVFDGLYQAQAP